MSYGFGTAQGEYLIPGYHKESKWSDDDLQTIIERVVAERFDDCITVGHNAKFDQLWIYVHHQILWRLKLRRMSLRMCPRREQVA